MNKETACLDELKSICLIGTSKDDLIPLSYTQDDQGLHIALPDQPPLEQEAYVIRLQFESEFP